MRYYDHDHSWLCRTRFWVPDSGFLTTIQNMMDVARLSAYLTRQRYIQREEKPGAYQVKMYCV